MSANKNATAVCLQCGGEFRIKEAQRDKRRYCSYLCRNVARWGTDPSKHNWACEVCGKTAYLRPAELAWRKTCSYECSSKRPTFQRSGANHPNWKGGISHVLRTIHMSQPMRKWALEVIAASGGKCAHCDGAAEEAHHIEEVAKVLAILFDPKNGIALCKPCHAQQHGKVAKTR